MAYVTMTTRSAGYVVPASEWNQLIANDNFLKAQLPGSMFNASAGYLYLANDLTETIAVTVSVPAGFLGANQSIEYLLDLIVFNNKGTDGIVDVKAYYGATSVANASTFWKTFPTSGNRGSFSMRAIVSPYGATNAQRGQMVATLMDGAGTQRAASFQTTPTTLAIDSTAAQTAKITFKMNAADANFQVSVLYACVRGLPVWTL